MKVSLITKVYLGFGLVLVLLVALTAIAIRNKREFVHNNELVRQTYEVVDELREVEALVVSAESSRRAYILTRDEKLLTPHGTAKLQWPIILQSLRSRVANNPRQLQRLDQLQPVVEEKLTRLDSSIALRRESTNTNADIDTQQSDYTQAGIPITETIRQMIATLIREELGLLPERAARSQAYATATEVYMILGAALGFIMVLIAGMMVRRDVTERKRVELERQVIFEIIQGVSTSADLDTLLNLIHQTIKKVVFAENCFVALYDERTTLLSMKFFVDQFDPTPEPQKVGHGRTGYVFRTDQPILMTAELFETLVKQGEVESVGTPPAAWLGVPLRTPSKTIGVMAVQHYTNVRAFTSRHVEFLSSVGDQIAVAIDRKRAEEALGKSEDLYRDLVEHSEDLISTHDLEGNLLSVNPRIATALGYEQDELYGVNIREVLAPDTRFEFDQYLTTISKTGAAEGLMLMQTRTGEKRVWEYRNTLRTEGVAAPLVRGMAHDITERMRAEAALRESEVRYRTLAENASDVIVQINMESKILMINPAVEHIFGYRSEELIGRDLNLLMPEYLREVHKTSLSRHEKTGEKDIPWTGVELTALHAKGSEFPVEVSFGEYKERGERILTGFIRDVTKRKEADAALRASEERYREIFEDSVMGACVTSVDGKILTCNPAFARILGFASVTDVMQSKAVSLYKHPSDRDRFLDLLTREKRLENHEMELRRLDGAPIHVAASVTGIFDESGNLIELHAQMIDITERMEAEEALRASQLQLQQSQRLEAVGQLAGGVAHDFNNLLTAINGYSSLALRRIDDASPIKSYLDEVKKAGDRAANLTRQLLAFSRKQILEPKVLDLNDVVNDMSKMLTRMIGEDVQLATHLAGELGSVLADAGQIEQIIMNLVVNARDAMPKGGKVTIETANVYLDDEYAREHLPTQPGQYVMLAVSDTGKGMDTETQARIFEPFFTTKELGKGTGLGLSTVYGIVKQSGGYIWVYSELSHGTTFKIYLGRTDLENTPIVKAADEPMQSGSETILLVEDEDMVRELAREVLESAGYKVLVASRDEEATLICVEHPGEIHLLLSDVVMPGPSGKEIADRLTVLRPAMKVLFMSGYTQDAIVHHGVLDSGVKFIQKPFSPAALCKRVRVVLDSG